MIKNANAPLFSAADPYPWYRWVREEGPVFQTRDGGWMVSRYEDAEMLLKDPRCSHWGQDSRTFQYMQPLEKAIAQTLHALMPGGEPAFRRQIMHQLAARTLRIDEEVMKKQADDMLHRLKRASQVEFMYGYAHPFTFGTTCRVMGVPENEIDHYSDITSGLKGGYLSFISEEVQKESNGTPGRLFLDALRRLIFLRHKTPGNDLCSAILAVCPPDKQNEPFIISLMVLLFYAGHQNMMNFMGNALLALNGKLAEQSLLRESLSFAIESVDELIRYDSPLQSILLVTQEEISLHGHIIPAGSRLLISLGAANRDPSRFKDPDQLMLTRKPAHLGFGTGIFRCIGAQLARIQGGAGLHRFFAHVHSYTPVEDGVSWSSFAVQRGPSHVLLNINWNHE